MLIPTKTKHHFYLKTNDDIKYIEQNVAIESPILNENIYLMNKYNFINVNIREIFFYRVNYNYNEIEKKYNIEIIKNKMIRTKGYLNHGIYFINKDIFAISGLNQIYLFSFRYKELISIILYYNMIKIIRGYNNECYLLLDTWISGHKIIRQINFNESNGDKNAERGEVLVDGQTYLKQIDIYNRYCLIDLEEKICYIKVNKKKRRRNRIWNSI